MANETTKMTEAIMVTMRTSFRALQRSTFEAAAKLVEGLEGAGPVECAAAIRQLADNVERREDAGKS